MALHIETPLVESRPLSLIAERSVYLKLDALQPPGSFKIRGIGLACETYLARGHNVLFHHQAAMPGWLLLMPGVVSVCR